jgi:hypothetical protein
LLVKHDAFPVRVLRVGGRWRVPTADLRRALGLTVDEDDAA